jgi:hypothetical protein
LGKHQVNLKVVSIIAKMMEKVNSWSQRMHELTAPHVVVVTLHLVDDLSGELLVYTSNLWLPCGPSSRGFTMLWLSS